MRNDGMNLWIVTEAILALYYRAMGSNGRQQRTGRITKSVELSSSCSLLSRSQLLLPVGWQISATGSSLHGVEHLQVERADVALALSSGSRQLRTQPEVSTFFLVSNTEVTSVPTGLASVTSFVLDGEVAFALIPKDGTDTTSGLDVVGPFWVLLVELLKLLLPLFAQSSSISFPCLEGCFVFVLGNLQFIVVLVQPDSNVGRRDIGSSISSVELVGGLIVLEILGRIVFRDSRSAFSLDTACSIAGAIYALVSLGAI